MYLYQITLTDYKTPNNVIIGYLNINSLRNKIVTVEE